MTRRNALTAALSPLFAPLLAWLPGRRVEPNYIADPRDYPLLNEGPRLIAELPAVLSWDCLGYVADTSSLPDGEYTYVFDDSEQPPVVLVYGA